MGISLLFLAFTGFVVYFYMIGLWYLGLLPLISFIGFLGYYTNSISLKDTTSSLISRYGLLIAWIIILIGIVGILIFFGINNIYISQFLIAINIFFWLISHLFNYEDGKESFQWGYYLSIVFLFIISIPYISLRDFVNLFSVVWSMTLGICGFIVFVIGNWKQTEQNLWYKLFILCIGAILFVVVKFTKNIYLSLLINVFLLTIIYYIIYVILKNKPNIHQDAKQISINRILAGDKIINHKHTPNNYIYDRLYNYINNLPDWTKYFFEGINIFLTLVLISLYLRNIDSGLNTTQFLTFWGLIISFAINVFLLKKIGYKSKIQRLIVFVVLNFAIYINLFAFFGNNYGIIAFGAIIRNIISSIMIFSLPKFLKEIFQKYDYIYWLIIVICALVFNIIILSRSSLQGQLVFSLSFLYIGLQGMILFHATKYINNLQ